jgi:hypothetical protein
VKLKDYNPIQEEQLNNKQRAYWLLYHELKQYKKKPNRKTAARLKKNFDTLCEPADKYASLNLVLVGLKKKKKELLVVLALPTTSLHNNWTESEIREYAKRRKISAGTRSDNGRLTRDTFLSLKKNCRKLRISFWEYLLDRLQNIQSIPPLSQLMEQKHNLSLA